MSFTAKRVVRESQEVWEVGWDEWIADGEYKFTVVARSYYATEAAILCNYLNGGPHNPDVDTFHPAQLMGDNL